MVVPAELSTPTAAREAWRSFWRIFMEDKRRRWAILSELGISPQQSMAIGTLKPGEPMPMSALADALHCDNSNITGIVDRLEAAGLAERRPSERDRRVKAVVLTEKGEWMRVQIERRAGEPPPRIAALSAEDAIALRDILSRALDA
jgi:MarR family transcriptional regulator, organic hydroperoxide resistance regulator